MTLSNALSIRLSNTFSTVSWEMLDNVKLESSEAVELARAAEKDMSVLRCGLADAVSWLILIWMRLWLSWLER
jgi:hypothetical protein